MALSDLLGEIVASAIPEPNTDRKGLLLVLLACVGVTTLHAASPFLIAEGIMPSEWQPHVIAVLALVSAAAVVLGAVHLVRRTVGTALPCICMTAGLVGGWTAWFF
jgi:hypothetical protein